jgi:hypothetical protein
MYAMYYKSIAGGGKHGQWRIFFLKGNPLNKIDVELMYPHLIT